MNDDFFLALLVSMAEGGAEISIMLNVGGKIVCGDMISEREYFEVTASKISTGTPGLRDLFAETPSIADRAAMDRLDEEEDPEAAKEARQEMAKSFVHLKNSYLLSQNLLRPRACSRPAENVNCSGTSARRWTAGLSRVEISQDRDSHVSSARDQACPSSVNVVEATDMRSRRIASSRSDLRSFSNFSRLRLVTKLPPKRFPRSVTLCAHGSRRRPSRRSWDSRAESSLAHPQYSCGPGPPAANCPPTGSTSLSAARNTSCSAFEYGAERLRSGRSRSLAGRPSTRPKTNDRSAFCLRAPKISKAAWRGSGQ